MKTLSARELRMLWEKGGTLYTPEDTARETAALRELVGAACGGWQEPSATRADVAALANPEVGEVDDGPAEQQPPTYVALATAVGVSSARVSQIVSHAIRKARVRDRHQVGRVVRPLLRSLNRIRENNLSSEDLMIAALDAGKPDEVLPFEFEEARRRSEVVAEVQAAAAARTAALAARIIVPGTEPSRYYYPYSSPAEYAYAFPPPVAPTRADALARALLLDPLVRAVVEHPLFPWRTLDPTRMPCPCGSGRTIFACHTFARLADALRVARTLPCPCASGALFGACHERLVVPQGALS